MAEDSKLSKKVGELKDGENYRSWKEGINKFFQQEGFDKYATQRPEYPTKPQRPTLPTTTHSLDTPPTTPTQNDSDTSIQTSSTPKGKGPAATEAEAKGKLKLEKERRKMFTIEYKMWEHDLEEYQEEVKRCKKWEEVNKKAAASIWFCLAHTWRYLVKDLTSIVEIWEKLDEVFLKRERLDKIELRATYVNWSFDNSNIQQQFIKYEMAFDRAVEAGCVFTATDRKEQLLAALLSKYDTLLNDYKTIHHDKFVAMTYEELKELVIDRAMREYKEKEKEKKERKEEKEEKSTEKALTATNTNNPPPKHDTPKYYADMECYNCKQKGHSIADCEETLKPENLPC